VSCSCNREHSAKGSFAEKNDTQKEAGYGAGACGRDGQLREGVCFRGGSVRESSNEVLQLVICEEQDCVFGHGAHYRGG
jgi:hypothetical protein